MDDWKLVMVPNFEYGGMTYSPGFDRDMEYEFKRLYEDDSEASRYKLADAHPYFNIANLMFRPVTAPTPNRELPST